MSRTPAVAVVALLASTVASATGCTDGHPAAPPAPPTRSGTTIGGTEQSVAVAKARLAARAAAYRARAHEDAARLVALVPVPPDATPASHHPSALDSPGGGRPATRSFVDVARFLHSDRSLDQVLAWARAHPPRRFGAPDGTATGSGPSGITEEVLSWSLPDRPYETDRSFSLSVAPDPSGGSFLRADGTGEWLDPRPVPDTRTGRRMRLSVAAGCPRTDRGYGDVTNTGNDLDLRLLPTGTPAAALICQYAGGNGPHAWQLAAKARLGRRAAARLADRVRALPLAHTVGDVYNCPALFGLADVVAVRFAGRPDVDLWVQPDGCAGTSNGHIFVMRIPKLTPWLPSERPPPPT